MKFSVITFLVMLSLATVLKAQNYRIEGRVSVAGSKESIEAATVIINSLKKQAVTNEKGYFQLSAPAGTYLIQVISLGMEAASEEIILNKDINLNFELNQLSTRLGEIEIRDERPVTSGIARLKSIENFGIYEAKKNEIILLDDFAANKVANNARQVFAKVPGLNIWESDYAGLQLDIAARGLGPSRSANFNTRQNGYDMSADALGYPESYYMPAMQAVERIEIVRGAASLQYGTQFGGMLNFKLKEAPERPVEVNLEQAAGSFGMLNSFVSVGGKTNKLDYYTYYQYRSGDGWRENSGFNSHIAFSALGYQLSDKLKLKLEYSFMNYQAQQPGGLTDDDFREGNLNQSRRGRNWFQVNWNLLALIMDYRFSHRTSLNLRTFGLYSSRDALGNLEQIGVPDNPNSNRTLIHDQFANFGKEARLIHRYALNNRNSALLIGTRYYQGLTERVQGDANNSANPDFFLLNPEDPEEFDYRFPSRNLSFFIENLTDITDKLSVTAGFRLEHIRTDAEGVWKLNRFDFAGNLISSTANTDQSSERRSFPLLGIGASYYIKDDLNLYSNFAQNFRSITFSDLRVVNPNFQLDSLITDENGYNVDLGIRGALRNWLDVDVSVFLMRYNDRIGLYELPGSTTLFRTNIGDSRHIGIESYLELKVFDLLEEEKAESKLSVFLNLALTNANYIRSDITSIKGRRVEYVPNVMLRTGINYSWKSIKATYQYSYLGDQFSDATNSVFNPNALTGLIPSYQVMDLSLEYNPGRYKITFGVNNLTNEQYFTRRAEAYPGPGIIPATIRSFYASLGIKI